MAYPQHWLLSYGGTLYGGADIWSNNIRFATDDGGSPGTVDETSMVQSLGDIVAAFVASADSGYSNRTQLEWVKFNEIAPNGGYVDDTTTHVREFAPAVSGTQGTVYPPQVALAISLYTDFARGYASKGRVFIPCPKEMNLTGNGHISATTQQAISVAWAAFIYDLGNMPGLDLTGVEPAIVSRVPLEGAQHHITRVRVGSVLDTQTRRRNAMTETYADSVVL